jgi:4-hydroxybenzoate polyprenyltransferase
LSQLPLPARLQQSDGAVSRARPIAVDLDGTLIKTDLLVETGSRFLIDNPLFIFRALGWLSAGKHVLKGRLAHAAPIDVTKLPYNQELLAWLRQQKSDGRVLVLATASHKVLADQVAAHLGLFDEVFATDEHANLKGMAKRDALVERYGHRGFDYVGNDWPDMSVWQSAGQAHVVSRSARLTDKIRSTANLGVTIDDSRPGFARALLAAMRPHQWLKNLLIFVPLFAAHEYGSSASTAQALLAFVVFGLVASSVYLLNDLADVADDRHHERKRHRPFAAGHISLLHGWLAWPVLLVLAFALAAPTLPWRFTATLALYFGLTTAYSFGLKRRPVVDVLTLAALYTLRIIAGAMAIAVPLSFWLLSFSMFIFLSLAFIKRYSEVRAARETEAPQPLRGRGYGPQDLELIASLGSSSGYLSVLVLALYIQDSHTAALYAEPRLIWLACPVLLFWISRAWLIAHRGQMHDDPVIFALKDRTSWLAAGLLAAVFISARVA